MRKEMRGRRGRCPWGRDHWSRQSSGRVRRGRWGRGGCWRSSDLEGRQPIRVSESCHMTVSDDAQQVCVTCVWAGGQGRRGQLWLWHGRCVCVPGSHVCVQLLQRRGEAGVSSRASHSERQASQRIRDSQSRTVPAVQELCCPLVAQSTSPHLQHTYGHTQHGVGGGGGPVLRLADL